jgi:hypothetical protein
VGIDCRNEREAVVTKVGTTALLVLLVCSLFPAAVQGQADEQQVMLYRTADGIFVAANSDGTLSTTQYVVPVGQEFCLTDVIWMMGSPPNLTLSMSLLNINADGATNYRIWSVTATTSGAGEAAGQSSFKTGPKITSNGQLQPLFPQGLSAASFTLYGKQRAASTAPCS